MSQITIKPIGGVGQIGSNSTLVQTKNDSFIIDSGILFPNEDFFNLNYLIPDLDSLEVTPSKLFITHGHEDHIGAVIHYLKKYPEIEVFAPHFATELIRRKLDFNKVSHKIITYSEEDSFNIEDITLMPIHVNHSIPDTFGFLLNFDKTSLFFASDFKIDDNSPYEKPFNFDKLIENSKDSACRILFSDSTNIMSSNLNTPSEGDLVKPFEDIFSRDFDRFFVTCFASNVHRMQTIVNAAHKNGLRVVPYGRSIISYMETAKKIGIFDDKNVVRSADSIYSTDKKLVIIASGCQGDFRGALRRIVSQDDKLFKPKERDLVVFSSKPIPGNEKKMALLYNRTVESGASIIAPGEEHIHVSGHPGKDDLKSLYNKFNPTDIVPIHGESLFLKRHEEFISKTFPQINTHLISNYDSIVIKDNKVKLKKTDALDPKIIHGMGLEIERPVITQRRKIAENGAILLSVKTETLLKKKVILKATYTGLPQHIDNFKEEYEALIVEHLKSRRVKTLESTSEDVRVLTRRFFNNILGYRPITIVHFI